MQLLCIEVDLEVGGTNRLIQSNFFLLLSHLLVLPSLGLVYKTVEIEEKSSKVGVVLCFDEIWYPVDLYP